MAAPGVKRALFVVSARGQGHLVRCRALASELTSRGWRCSLSPMSPRTALGYDVSVIDGEEYGPEVYEALKDRPAVAVVDTARVPWSGWPYTNLLVWGSAGATWEPLAEAGFCGTAMLGPRAAILRPEFREMRRPQLPGTTIPLIPRADFDARNITGLHTLALAALMRGAGRVITYGGMRALEAACVRGNALGLEIEARNPGEELNKAGLLADPAADLVDGLGCGRVADAIEELAK